MTMNWTGVKYHSGSIEHLLCCTAALQAPSLFLFATGWHSWLITYWTQLCLTTHPGVEQRRSRTRPGILTLWRYTILNEPQGIQSHLAAFNIQSCRCNCNPALKHNALSQSGEPETAGKIEGKEGKMRLRNKCVWREYTSVRCKSVVYPKMKTLTSFTHHDVVPKLYCFSVRGTQNVIVFFRMQLYWMGIETLKEKWHKKQHKSIIKKSISRMWQAGLKWRAPSKKK